MKKIFILILFLLFAVGGGYLLATKVVWKNEGNEQQIPKPTKNIEQTETEGKKIVQESPKSILLKAPDASVSAEQKLIYDKLLKTNARDSGIIFVNKDCDISPTITRIKKKSEFKLINEDEETHIVKIGETYDITLDAEKIETIKEDYPLGSVPILCDQKLSGYIYVEL